jgi:hypothetical protein
MCDQTTFRDSWPDSTERGSYRGCLFWAMKCYKFADPSDLQIV